MLGLVSGIIGASPGLIVGQPNFVKKVVFPLEVLPAAMTGALAYDLLIGLGLSLTGIAILGPGLTPNAFYVPIIVCPVFLMAFGLSWFFSALGVFVRDIGHLGTFLGLALLYSSGVFYSAEKAEAAAPGYGSFCNGIHFFRLSIPCAKLRFGAGSWIGGKLGMPGFSGSSFLSAELGFSTGFDLLLQAFFRFRNKVAWQLRPKNANLPI